MKIASLAAGGYGVFDDDGIRPVPDSMLARYPTLRTAIAGNRLSDFITGFYRQREPQAN